MASAIRPLRPRRLGSRRERHDNKSEPTQVRKCIGGTQGG
jgi:hypothetical protein